MTYPKHVLIQACRLLGIKTGDTARNPKRYYEEALQAYDNQLEVQKVLSSIIGDKGKPESPELPKPEEKQYTTRTVQSEILFGDIAPGFFLTAYDGLQCPQVDKTYIFNPKHLQVALCAIANSQNVWLAGPKGTGKTTFAAQIAAKLGRPFVRISFDATVERYDLFGGERVRGGTSVWSDGVLIKAVRQPGTVILLDEICRARPEYLIALNALLEPGGGYTIPETGEHVRVAQDVVFIAADNTNGRGDVYGQYIARQIDPSTIDRFAYVLQFDYPDPEAEAEIISSRAKCSKQLAKLVAQLFVVLRTRAETGVIAEPPSTRQAIALATAIHNGLDPDLAFEVCLINQADSESTIELRALHRTHFSANDAKKAAAGEEVNIEEVNIKENQE